MFQKPIRSGIILAFLGGMFAVQDLREKWARDKIEKDGIQAYAIIVKKFEVQTHIKGGVSTSQYVDLKFNLPDLKPYTRTGLQVPKDIYGTLSENSTILVKYLKDEPENVKIEGIKPVYSPLYGQIGGGVSVFGLGLAGYGIVRKKRERAQRR